MTNVKTYRPAGLPSINQPDGDRRFLKQELDKLQLITNNTNSQIATINTQLMSPPNTIKGNNTGVTTNTLDLTPAQVQAMLGGGPGRIPLLGATTFWVSNSTGSDTTGLGTNANPWKTFAHAFNVIIVSYDLRGFTATIKSKTVDTYPSGVPITNNWTGGGSILFDGNGSTISTTATSDHCFVTSNAPLSGVLQIQNFTCTTAGAAASAIFHSVPGLISVGPGMTYGATTNPQIEGDGVGAAIQMNNSYTISGGAPNHIYCGSPGVSIFVQGVTCTISVAVNITIFVQIVFPSTIQIAGNTYVNPGNVTGTKYFANIAGVINTNGAGAGYLPGTIAGSVANNGLYV